MKGTETTAELQAVAVNKRILPILPHAQTGFPELCVHRYLHHFGVIFTALHEYFCQFIK